MKWQPGQSGNPAGRMPEKVVTDALRMEAQQIIKSKKSAPTTKLRRMCRKVMDEAVKGKPWAVNVVFDRLEGRPLQPITQDVTYNPSEVFLELLRRMNGLPPRTLEIEHQQEPAE